MSSGSSDLLRETLRVSGPALVDVDVTVGLKSARPRREGRTVTGRILDTITGKPWIAEAVYLSRTSGTIFSDGSFEFFGVAAGSYVLEAHEGAPGGRAAQVDIVVGNGNVTQNLSYTSIPASVRVAGRVTVEAGGALPRFNAGRIVATAGSNKPIVITPELDGSFKAGLQQGDYQLSVEGFPPGLMLKPVEPLRIEPRNGPAIPDIIVTLGATPRFKVRGRVLAVPPTRPVEGAVVALDDGPERYNTTAAADGTFELSNVLPGQYRISIRPFGFSNVTDTIVIADQDLNLEYKSQPLY
jgi:hypothetical protein